MSDPLYPDFSPSGVYPVPPPRPDMGIIQMPPVYQERIEPRSEAIPQGVGNAGLGQITDLLSPLWGVLETKIMGIPLWAIGGGAAAYYFFFGQGSKRGSYSGNPRGEEGGDGDGDGDGNGEYGYDDLAEEFGDDE